LERIAQISRKTAESDISIELDLDGTGTYEIKTGIKFLDHMLMLLAKHSGINLKIHASGDLTHHIVEDIGIVLGKCFNKALGDKKGIIRYGFTLIPMDESLARCAIDLSGRKALEIDLKLNECDIEDVAIEDVYHFFDSFAENAKINLHLHVLYGTDQHHKIEAATKALAISLNNAVKIISERIPSTKGTLEH